MFLAPDVSKVPYVPSGDGGAGRRQYVNLVTARNGQDAFGHEVLFEVCANPRADGRAGDRIYVQAMFSRASSRNNPLPTLMNSPAVSDLKTPADDAHTGWVVLDADGGTAKFKVNLGLAGGDDCAVAISGRKDDYTDATITLVNWRKLFCQLRYPAMFAGQLAANGLIAIVSLSPGVVGGNEVHITVTPPGGSITPIASVAARVSLPSAAVPNAPVTLVKEGVNHYSGSVTFPRSGDWTLEVVIQVTATETALLSTTVPIP